MKELPDRYYRVGDHWSIHYVPQDTREGCGVACLAMITGTTEPVMRDQEAVLSETFLDWLEMGKILQRHGYLSAWSLRYGEIGMWPPRVFAPVHLINLLLAPDAPLAHWVIRVGNSVLDPGNASVRTWDEFCRAYPRVLVQHVGGIWKDQES